MDMEHRVWCGAIQTPEKLQLGTCAYVLLLSHFTCRLESGKNESRRVVCQVKLQILLVECKVAGSIPEKVCFLRLQAYGNECSMQSAYSDACCVKIVQAVA